MRKKMWRIAVTSVGCICLFGGVAAQDRQAATPPREITLKQALEEIQSRTGYIVMVNYDNIPASKMVSLPSESMTADELARRVLSGTGYTGEMAGRRILIVPEPPKTDDGAGAIGAMWRTTGCDESVEMRLITFRTGSTAIEADFMGNSEVLEEINRALTDSTVIASLDHISVTAASSPDGSTASNERLAVRRAQNTKGYLERRYPHIASERVQAFSAGEEWSGLQKLVAEDPNVPEGEAVVAMLDTISPDANIRDSIRTIADGRAWRYMASQLLPNLRAAAAITLHFADSLSEQRGDTLRVATPAAIAGSGVQRMEFARVEEPCPPVVPPLPEPEPVVPKPLFAVKTNVLSDAVGALNLEVEMPIGERWSLAGEVVFPWWRGVSGTIEARRWFGDRTTGPLMTGWFAGVYFGGGTYDMKWNSARYKGDFFHTGISGGYAHPLNRSGNMRMEYSLGVGYLGGKYTPTGGEIQKLRWIGPTRAKVSLVWMVNWSN